MRKPRVSAINEQCGTENATALYLSEQSQRDSSSTASSESVISTQQASTPTSSASTTPASSPTNLASTRSSGLTAGVVARIGVGYEIGGLLIAIIAFVIWRWRRRRRSRHESNDSASHPPQTAPRFKTNLENPELQGNQLDNNLSVNLRVSNQKSELASNANRHELEY